MAGAIDLPRVFNQELLEVTAKQAADPALKNSSFRIRRTSWLGQHDWRRFLSGAPLTSSDIAAGIAVTRRVIADQREEVSLEAMPTWLFDRLERVIILSGEAGEGKSTYTHLLLKMLGGTFVAIDWDVSRAEPSDFTRLLEYQDSLRRYLIEKTHKTLLDNEPPIIVVGRIPEGISRSAADALCFALNERAENPDPSVVFLTGRPSEVLRIRKRFSAENLELAPLSLDEAEALRERINTGYRSVSAKVQSDGVRHVSESS